MYTQTITVGDTIYRIETRTYHDTEAEAITGSFTVLVSETGERFILRSWNMVPENGQIRRGAYYYARSTDTGKKMRHNGDVVVFWKQGNRLSVMSA